MNKIVTKAQVANLRSMSLS